jgi:hypothetical protein
VPGVARCWIAAPPRSGMASQPGGHRNRNGIHARLGRDVEFGRVLILRNHLFHLFPNGRIGTVHHQGSQVDKMLAERWPTHQVRVGSG